MSADEDHRLNEFYKYHLADQATQQLPHDAGVQVDQVLSPDTTLTAFCQLAALRLGVQRCGISTVSRYQQYILAESTRTTNLADTSLSDDPEDALWLGMCQCNRAGNLCENTVALPPALDSEPPPCFTVPDLRDSRFREAPYVTGGPLMRFYCGTPITSPNGHNIGSLWVLDARLRPEFTDQQKQFFGTVASLVMKHLETTKDSLERRKASRMNQAIYAFVDGKVPLPLAYAHSRGTANSAIEQHRSIATYADLHGHGPEESTDDFTESAEAMSALSLNGARSMDHDFSKPEFGSYVDTTGTEATGIENIDRSGQMDQEDRGALFARASYLMKDALDATGCVFLDTALGSLAGLDSLDCNDEVSRPGDERESVQSNASTPMAANFADKSEQRRRKRSTPGLLASTNDPNTSVAEVLGFAIENISSLVPGLDKMELGFSPLDEEFLLELAKRYPSGTLWSYQDTGDLFPIDESPSTNLNGRTTKRRSLVRNRRQYEAALLRRYFPNVRQILFVPLFDSTLGRSTAGCIAFSNHSSRVFTMENELPFMRSFINNVGAQISRIEASALSSSKSDFIGSISHELRSPLHGILAGADFLLDTEVDTYQKSLILTQISCGKTLLQVIEHVLDYSKINSFVKDERSAQRHNSDVSSENLTFGSKMQNLFEQTDICELAEEVVEGSVAGKAHMATIGLASPNPQTKADSDAHKANSVYGFMKNVAVILDFEYQKDWVYVAQPGALRRILMNILGNSLKYTASGCIRVRLSLATTTGPNDESSDTIHLSISDTGRGISKEFLRKRLFTPFNQEDHLSAGCGLGLSIVKSLLDTLNGHLEVRSEQGVGTTVSVYIPLSRGTRSITEQPTLTREGWMDSNLSLPLPETSVGFVGFIVPSAVDDSVIGKREAKIKESIKASVSTCMIDWLQMHPIVHDAKIESADYVAILVDERLQDFIQPYVDDLEKKQPRVIALLSSEMSRRSVENTLGSTIRAFEVVSAPFGPRKMARAVAACEKTASKWHHSRATPLPSNVDPLRKIGEDMEVGSDLLQAHGLTVGSPNKRETSALDIPGPAPVSRQDISYPETTYGSVSTTVAAPSYSVESSSQVSEAGDTTSTTGSESQTQRSRLLLVDDNHINLRFLETFVKKRRPNCDYDCAEDGLQAVEAAQRRESGYSVIFMDVSMPVMDGFEATRKIRALEKERQTRLGHAAPPPALIIALTGLASSRDQASAFASGVDLFMTKPVKFKEIGKLLDDKVKD